MRRRNLNKSISSLFRHPKVYFFFCHGDCSDIVKIPVFMDGYRDKTGVKDVIKTGCPECGHPVEIDEIKKIHGDDDYCRVCSEPVVDGRWSYCSDRCRRIANAVQSMFLWDSIRDAVLNRDAHTCQACGLSKAMATRAAWHVRNRVREIVGDPDDYDEWDEWNAERERIMARYNDVTMPSGEFHVDHITPISKGGHKFDETNLQTLCRDRHHAKTAEENRATDESEDAAPEITLMDYME